MTHRFPIRVYYEDTDMAGVVYYVNYLKYIERARSDWVREMGIDQNAMRDDDGIVFVVRRVEADYLASARFDDELEVQTNVVSASGVRLIMEQHVTRQEACLFSAIVTIVCVNADGKPVRLPANIR
ncbi:MAG: tol-pal system-associated acyl-CoA thioesterase [Pseudomonadota bacterium]